MVGPRGSLDYGPRGAAVSPTLVQRSGCESAKACIARLFGRAGRVDCDPALERTDVKMLLRLHHLRIGVGGVVLAPGHPRNPRRKVGLQEQAVKPDPARGRGATNRLALVLAQI